MPRFQSPPGFAHGNAEALGVLLVNLGTPRAPTAAAVRPFLREFLSDPRVVELPRWLWWPVLNGVVLPVRPARSARAYRKIWREEGSPLLVYSRQLAAALGTDLAARLQGNVPVELAMSYGEPSLPDALERLASQNVQRLLVLPLYPQYSGTTTGSVFDAVTARLSRRRWVPELRFVNHYHDDPAYIDTLAESVRAHRARAGAGELLLFSFHGTPRQTLIAGDPYHCQCRKTARLVAGALNLADAEWSVSFQSRVGRAEWLRPYTDETVRRLGAGGLGRLDVICAGFAVDCLETLEEIAMRNAQYFRDAGGGELRYIAALNASAAHVSLLSGLIRRHASGWPETAAHFDPLAGLEASRERAMAMGAER